MASKANLHVEVTEDSMQLGKTGFVLSLLTLGDAD